MDWTRLVEAALDARRHAHAPHSGFAVGAGLQTDGGEIFSGCNVENRSFGATLCAERVAIATAVAAGARRVEAVVVATDARPPAPPCGLCLQMLAEFATPELPVLLVNLEGEQQQYLLRDLLPHPFQFPGR
jgi:homotetrameric cytidine deaminase